MRKFFLIILVLFSTWNKLFPQLMTNNNNNAISISFHFAKIEARPNESLFNILTVTNNSSNKFLGKVKFNQPAGWQIIGAEETELDILPGDSVKIPVRVAVANTAMGEIAYTIVATLIASNGRPLHSEYCFINIPRVSSLKILAPSHISYFDNTTNEAKFQYKITNRGNTNEALQLNLKGDEVLSVGGKSLDETQAYEYIIPAHTDTTVELSVKLDKLDISKDFFRVDINSYTQDSIYGSRIWFSKIDNEYTHVIPEANKCAIVELTGSNILSSTTPRYSLMAKGKVLLKHNTDIYYFFRKNNLQDNWDDYYDIRAYVGINTTHFQYQIGTLQNIFNEPVFGIGNILELRLNNVILDGHYLNNELLSQDFYGGSATFLVRRKVNLEFGYAENNVGIDSIYTKIALARISFSFLGKNRFYLKTYLNNTTHATDTPFEKQGFAALASYTGNFNKLQANARIDYGSPEYSGNNRGKLILNSNLNYLLGNNDRINLSYNKIDNINIAYINHVQQPIKKTFYDGYELTYIKSIDKNTSLHFGPVFKIESTNLPYILTNPGIYFNTLNYRFAIAVRYNNTVSKVYLKPKIDFGQIMVNNDLAEVPTTKKSVLTYNINLYSVYRNFNLYGQFRNGPSGIFSQYSYFESGYYSKWLVFIPAYNKDFFNQKLNLDLRGNYRYDITNQNKYYSLATQLTFFLPDFWTLRVQNSLTSHTKYDALNNTNYRYSTTYFEASIRKEFNCKQPRFQYYNLNVVFFKDLNGNRVKENNEPGLRNVLVSIEPDMEVENNDNKKDFVSQKLLTGPDGTVDYKNIVNGAYQLKYILIGDMVGNFNREEMSQSFEIDKDKTLYIPYLENNRIVGKVILNRDPLSSYGNIDISNIRIIAEDTKGHTYSALTDKEGRFIIYAPVTDFYIVKINNIFYDNFDLQQPEFVVKFNGYKQFEVTFVFDEKKRKINFDTEITNNDENMVMDDLKAIRKTTLTGKIRDAITLDPVDARIEIIDNKTGKVISSSISNKLNGNYSISYVAGENFRIEVKAQGYWDHVENLYIEQVISIQNIAKDIMLNKTSDGPKKQTFIIYDEKEEEKFTENFKAGQKIPMNHLNFDEKETRLNPEAYPELDRLIDLLEKNKNVRIQIAGHADDSGKERIDNLLALRRAKAVARYLTSHELDESRIEVISYSNKRPLVPGSSEKAKQKNRRVEITVL